MNASTIRIERAWQVLGAVLDPEVPALSICDLGIVRDVRDASGDAGDELVVVLTPTYSGCPATEVIERSVIDAIEASGLGHATVAWQRAPAWTSDWISDEGRHKLREYGIAPPGPSDLAADAAQPIRIVGRRADAVGCPHCGAAQTEQLSPFGSTACKALYRCLDCRDPFEYFKPI